MQARCAGPSTLPPANGVVPACEACFYCEERFFVEDASTKKRVYDRRAGVLVLAIC